LIEFTSPTWFYASDDAWHSIEFYYPFAYESIVARVGFDVAFSPRFVLYERFFETADERERERTIKVRQGAMKEKRLSRCIRGNLQLFYGLHGVVVCSIDNQRQQK